MRTLDGQICIVLLLFSFLHLACSLPSALVDTKKCKKSNGDFPKIGSFCRSFYRCNNWVPVEMICPLDQHFFPAGGYCVWPEEFPCLDRPASEHCPEPNGKFLKPDTNCKVYYDCCNGRPSEKRCPGDTLFDSSSRKCDWPELVACPDDASTTKMIVPSTLAYTTSTKSSTPSSSPKDRITTVTSYPTSSKTLTPDSDKDSSEEGKTSEESKEYTTKYKIKSTYPTVSTVSSTILEKITTIRIVTEDLKETPSSTKEKSTNLPVTSYKSSSTVATSTETKSRITTVPEDSTVSETPTISTSRIDVTTDPVVLTDKTSAKTTDDVNYREKDSTTTTSSITDVVTYHIFCPKPDGYFPHPSNKHQFIACVKGNPTIMNCPSNLVYDHKTKSCQYKISKNSETSFN